MVKHRDSGAVVPIDRAGYIVAGYLQPFDKLPTREEFRARLLVQQMRHQLPKE